MTRALVGIVALAAVSLGCGPRTPDPKVAAEAFAAAAARGDADALYAMLPEHDRATYSRDDLRALVKEQGDDLKHLAEELRSPAVRVRGRARLRFEDGEEAELDLERRGFAITSALGLPAGSARPEETLAQLRAALSRRSYLGVLRILSPSTRAAIERDVRSLVDGLERPDALDIRETGDRAEVSIPGGHSVKLRREGGLWRVDHFH